MPFIVILSTFLYLVCSPVEGVQWKREEEGSCRGVNYQITPNVDTTFLNSTRLYILGGSKYHLYRITTNPQNAAFPDYQFYYESCPMSDGISTTSVFAYGDVATTHDIRPVTHGVIDFIELSNPLHDNSRHYVTLTDNRSFVFFANCWMKADQRSWNIISTTPTLTPGNQRLIERHAMSLGFDPEKFVFLRYDNCKAPISQPERKSRSRNRVKKKVTLSDLPSPKPKPKKKVKSQPRRTPAQALYGDHGANVRLQNFGWQIY